MNSITQTNTVSDEPCNDLTVDALGGLILPQWKLIYT